MKKMNCFRFKNLILKCIVVMSIICLLVISCTIPASAYSNSEFPNDNNFPRVNLPCSRPKDDDSIAYAEILTKQGREFQVYLFVFEFVSGTYDAEYTIVPKLNGRNILSFTSYVSSNHDDFASLQYDCYSYDSITGLLELRKSSLIDDVTNAHGETLSYTFPYSIYGIHYYGFDLVSASIPEFQVEFVVTYAGEGLVLNYLEYFQYTFTRSLDILNQSISALDVKFQNFSEECIMYLNAQLSHLTNMEIYLETLTEQNNQMINGPPGSDDDDDPPPEEVSPPRNDSTVDDIKEAEKDAVGGKTDEEIKEDIKDTLDFEDKKDEVNGEEIETSDIEVSHNTFNLVFDFMGGAWNSYFILSLTIAFAAFLIGRRY